MTTKKKIIPITIGAINFPNKIPNLIQAIFKGVRALDFNNPKVKKIKAIKSLNYPLNQTMNLSKLKKII